MVNIISPTGIYKIKPDASGKQEWSKAVNTAYPSFGADAMQATGGRYIISGYEGASGKNYNATGIKADANGYF